MYNFKINEIKTNDGSTIIPNQINIIIGPNSSGKSRFLKEIRNSLSNNHRFQHQKNIIIKNYEYELPNNKDEFLKTYDIANRIFISNNDQRYIRNYSGINNPELNFYQNNFNNYFDTGRITINQNWLNDLDIQIKNFKEKICHNKEILSHGNFSNVAIVHETTYVEDKINGETVITEIGGGGGPLYTESGQSIEQFLNIYGQLFFNYIGTEEKLLMCKSQKNYSLNSSNTNLLSEIQFNETVLNNLSNYTKDMFKKDIYLDKYTLGDMLTFRIGDDFNFIRNAHRENKDVELMLNNYKTLDDEGDGIKSFVTTYLTLNLNDKNILLLDEPENFLHPPLAKQIGEIIGRAANKNKQIFVSTHSVDLLKGILNSSDNVNIIRITKKDEINNIKQLNAEEIKKLTNDALLCSPNVLNGLFCEKTYICEAESDEEFYRCLHDKVNPSDSCFFVHGKNKQTLKDISETYNKLDITNYRIYDFDILRDEDFNKAIKKFVTKEDKDKYIELRKKVNEILKDKEQYHNGGINIIQDKILTINLNKMFNELKRNGIIILKDGCLETTLIEYGVPYTKNKNNWFKSALKLINNSEKNILENTSIYRWIYN